MSLKRRELGKGHESRPEGMEYSGKERLYGGYKLLRRRADRRHNKRRNGKSKGLARQHWRKSVIMHHSLEIK